MRKFTYFMHVCFLKNLIIFVTLQIYKTMIFDL